MHVDGPATCDTTHLHKRSCQEQVHRGHMDMRTLPAALPAAAKCLPPASCFRAGAPPRVRPCRLQLHFPQCTDTSSHQAAVAMQVIRHIELRAGSVPRIPEVRACRVVCWWQHSR